MRQKTKAHLYLVVSPQKAVNLKQGFPNLMHAARNKFELSLL